MIQKVCCNPLELSDFTHTSTLPDFTFVIDKIKYKCKTIQICSISKTIFEQISEFFKQKAKNNSNETTEESSEDSENYIKNFTFDFDSIPQTKSNKISCDKLKDPHHYFKTFLSAVEGQNITITKFNAFFLSYLASVLQIEELKKSTEPFLSFKLNTTNALQILFYFSESNIRNEEVIDYVVQNWSQFDFSEDIINAYLKNPSNIYDKNSLSKLEKMIQCPFEFFEFVFSNPKFKPKSDKWLCSFINLLVKKNSHDKNYCLLYKYIKMEKLKQIEMNHVLRHISKYSDPTYFVSSLEKRFTSVISRNSYAFSDSSSTSSEHSEDEKFDENDNNENNENNRNNENYRNYRNNENNKNNENNEYYQNDNEYEEDDGNEVDYDDNEDEDEEKVFPYKYEYNEKFKGVFSYFKSKRSFDINVKCFCGGGKSHVLFHLFEYDDAIRFEYYWDSYQNECDINNAWFVVSFPNHMFNLTNYTLATSPKSKEYTQNGVQPKSWVMQASKKPIAAHSFHFGNSNVDEAIDEIDRADWETIDQQNNNQSLLSKGEVVRTFGCQSTFYRSFRFKMLQNHASPDSRFYGLLKLSTVEFYGILKKC